MNTESLHVPQPPQSEEWLGSATCLVVTLLLPCRPWQGRLAAPPRGGEEQELGSEAIWSLHYRNRQRSLSTCKQVTVQFSLYARDYGTS